MGYVFFGGMRGTAWVNTFQTILFLSFGAIAVAVIAAGMGGFRQAIESMLASPSHGAAPHTRTRVAALFLQLHLHPALVARLPAHRHLLPDGAAALDTSARRSCSIRLCMLAIWLPSVFLGVVANRAVDLPSIQAKLEARATLATRGAAAAAGDARQLRAAGERRRCDPAARRRVRAAVAGVAAGRGRDGSGDGERLADPRVVDDVHGGCVRVLWRHGALRTGRAGPDRTALRRAAHDRRLRDRAAARRSRSSMSRASMRSPAIRRWRRCWSRRCSGEAAPSGARWRQRVWTAAAVLAVAVLQSVVPAPPPGDGRSRAVARRRTIS